MVSGKKNVSNVLSVPFKNKCIFKASKEVNTFKVAVFQAQDSKKGSSFKSCSVYISSVRKIESSVKIMV